CLSPQSRASTGVVETPLCYAELIESFYRNNRVVRHTVEVVLLDDQLGLLAFPLTGIDHRGLDVHTKSPHEVLDVCDRTTIARIRLLNTRIGEVGTLGRVLHSIISRIIIRMNL